MNATFLPTSQGELIKMARGAMTQREFAKVLEVERSCLSRYESERLGAPTSVLNFCLRTVAALATGEPQTTSPIQRALTHARQAVNELEAAALERSKTTPGSRSRSRGAGQ